MPGNRPYGSVYLYRLRLSLLYDNLTTPVNGGDVLLSLPLNPNRDFVWTRSSRSFFRDPGEIRVFGNSFPAWSKCLIKNSHTVRQFLSLSGARSATLGHLAPTLGYCCIVKVPTVKPTVSVAFCSDRKPAIRPTSIWISCDSTGELQHMSWTTWGMGYAVGQGTEFVNNCKPNCAEGTFYPFSVTVQLSRPVPTGAPGEFKWSKASFTYPNGGPSGVHRYSMNLGSS